MNNLEKYRNIRDAFKRFLKVIFVATLLLPLFTGFGLAIALMNRQLDQLEQTDYLIITTLIVLSLIPLITFLVVKYAINYIIYGRTK